MKKAMAVCLLISVFTFGEMNSAFEHEFNSIDPVTLSVYCRPSQRGIHLLMAFDWAIFPPMWIIGPFMAHGIAYEHPLWSVSENTKCVAWKSGVTK